MKILVLGIGNTLLSDEGAGVLVVRHLAAHCPDLPDVALLDGGTLSFTLTAPIASADGLIAVDAARLDAGPGTVRGFEGPAMDDFLRSRRGSVHEVGLAELLDMARLAGELPRRRYLVGIQPRLLDWGERLSPEVEAAVPVAAARVAEIIGAWTGRPVSLHETP